MLQFKKSLFVIFASAVLFSNNEIGGKNVLELVQYDFQSGQISYDQMTQYAMFILKDQERLPEQYRDAEVPFTRCATSVLLEIENNWDVLSLETQNIYFDYFGEKDYGNSRVSYYTPEGHYIIIYQTTGVDAPSQVDLDGNGVPDYVEDVGESLEYSWFVEFDSLGWNEPALGGNQLVDVWIDELQSGGVLGYATGGCSNAQIHIDKALDIATLQSTCAHELHHTSQFCYTVSSSWYMECTSMYMEDVVYDDINDYIGYIWDFVMNPWLALDYFENGGLHQYGSVVWNFHIAEKYGNDAVQQVWLENTYSAISACTAFFADQGSTLSDEHLEFSVKCWMTGDRVNESHEHFEEAASWWFEPLSQESFLSYPVEDVTVDSDKYPDHLSWNYITFESTGDFNKLLILFDGESGIDWKASTILIQNGDQYTSANYDFDGNGDGFIGIDNWAQMDKVIFMPTNETTSSSGNDGTYLVSAYELDELLILDDYNFTDLDGNGELEPGDDVELTVTEINYLDNLVNVQLILTSDHPSITIVDGSVDVGAFAGAGSSFTNTDDPFSFSIASNATSDFAEFTVTVLADGVEMTSETIQVLIGVPSILLVDDDDGGNYEETIMAALDLLEKPYQVKNMQNDGLGSLSLLSRDIVIWSTGDDSSNPLSDDEIIEITSYLDAGRGLVLCGNHNVQDLQSDNFLPDYLKVYYGGKYANTVMQGEEGDPIGNGEWFGLYGTELGVDILVPANESDTTTVASLHYLDPGNGNPYSAIRHNDFYSLVLCGFDIGELNDDNPSFVSSAEFVSRVMNWLESVAPQCIKGDVNSDGQISILDIMLVVNIIMQSIDPTSEQICAADYTDDGIINILDIMGIVQEILSGKFSAESVEGEKVTLFVEENLIRFESTIDVAAVEIHAKVTNFNSMEKSSIAWNIFDNQVDDELILLGLDTNNFSTQDEDTLIRFSGSVWVDPERIIFSTLDGQSVDVEVFNSVTETNDGLEAIQITDYEILGNFPNPFNPETTIQFAVPEQGSVEILIYNVLGKVINSWQKEIGSAGVYEVIWNGEGSNGISAGSGIYYAVLKSANHFATHKIALIK